MVGFNIYVFNSSTTVIDTANPLIFKHKIIQDTERQQWYKHITIKNIPFQLEMLVQHDSMYIKDFSLNNCILIKT